MRKSLLKSLVGVAVLGATMAITSVAAMAADSVNAFVTGEKDSAVVAGTEYSTDTTVISVKPVDGQNYDTIKASGNYTVNEETHVAIRTNADGTTGVQTSIKIDGANATYRPNVYVEPVVDGEATMYWYNNGKSKNLVAVDTAKAESVAVFAPASTSAKALQTSTVDLKAGVTYGIGGQGTNQDFIGIVFAPSEAAAPEIVNGVTDGKLAVVNANGAYYAVALVSGASAAENASFKVSSDATQTFDTVYGSVELGGTTYTAADLGGGEKDYVYGFEVTVNGAPSSLAAVQDKVGSVQF